MFRISDETKKEAVETMKEVLSSNGATVPSDEVLLEVFNAAVRVVAKSFGM